MKKIYTFTLNSNDYPSAKFDSNLRLFAFMLYENIYNYDGENSSPLDINDNIEYNQINLDGYFYKLSSDLFDDGYTYYEPFMIGDRSVGITICDDNFDIKIIEELALYTLKLLNLNYNVTIKCISYHARDMDDEKNRDGALRLAFSELDCKFARKNNLLMRLIGNRNGKKGR